MWKMIEQDTITSDCSGGVPPNDQGAQIMANLFWWPAILKMCVVVKNATGGADDGKLELWARNLTSWTKLATSPDIFAGQHRIMAAVDGTDGAVVLAIHDLDASGYRFSKLAWSDPNFVWTEPYPGLDGSYFGTAGGEGGPPMMCSGTDGGRPRLFGNFDDGLGGYAFSSAGFDPSGGTDGLVLHQPAPAYILTYGIAYFAFELDPVRDVVVIFGGGGGDGLYAKVWESASPAAPFAEVEWSGAGPYARSGAAMCYHAALGKMLIYGGYAGAQSYRGRGAWSWNGTLWTREAGLETQYNDPVRGGIANNHFFRDRTRMAYDPVRGVPVVFRGVQLD